MKAKFIALLVCLTAANLIACGGEESEENSSNNAADLVECGSDTVEVDGKCEAAVECEDRETATTDGRCVFSDYCGDDTYFDPNSGLCRAGDLDCGENTTAEDGECVPEFVTACGEGTIVSDGACLPTEDVCGTNTEVDNQQQCRPVGEVCGEGTAFDFTQRVCVPLSYLTCGPGTRADGEYCISSRIYYEDLAANADLEMGPDSNGEILLKDQGELFVFTGTINEPTIDGDDLVQQDDILHFQADAGQWLQIGLYSLGLPEPGFLLADELDQGFSRISDLGAGIETLRHVVIPHTGTYELTISNLPQLLEVYSPAGGEDWNYVAYIEVVEAPDVQVIDLVSEDFSGDIRALTHNLYAVDGVEAGSSLALILDTLPTSSDAEVQVWTDLITLHSTHEISGDNIFFDVPGESFYLLFDRVHAFGANIEYSVSAQNGSALADGDSLTTEVDLLAGEYVGLFQFNVAGYHLRAAIKEGDEILVEQNTAVSTSTTGEVGLYLYAHSDTTVTLEVENDSGQDLDLVGKNYIVAEADHLEDIDADGLTYTYPEPLLRGFQHFVEVEIDTDELLAIQTQNTFGNAGLTLYDSEYETVQSGDNSLVGTFEPGSYLLSIKAKSSLNNGFSLLFKESQTFEFTETHEPALAIPQSPENATDTITVASCPSLTDISVDVNITYPYISDLHVRLTVPNGQTIDFHNMTGTGANMNDSFPYPDNNIFLSAAGLLDLVGTDVSGDWVFAVSNNHVLFEEGTLDNWTLNLSCEGIL